MKTIETKINRPALAAFALAAALFAGGSEAAALCSAPGVHPDGLSVSDVTFQGANADDCYGVIDSGPGGNPTGDTVWADTGWTMLAKDENGTGDEFSGTVEGIKFTLAAEDIGDKSGTWQLAWEADGDPGFPLTLDVVANLKAANLSASYLFEELTFTADGSGQGTWEIKFVNGGDQIPDLSNMTLWYKISDGRDLDPVPEPSTVLLMGLGFLGFGASRLKAKKS